MYDARNIALYLIKRADGDCEDLSLLKLLKLLYLIQGNYLAATGKAIFNDPIYAWKYGPIVKSVYDTFKGFGAMPLNIAFKENHSLRMVFTDDTIELPDKIFVDTIYSIYKRYSASYLVSMTHLPGTPWYNAFMPATQNGLLDIRDIIIDNESIKQYFIRINQHHSISSPDSVIA